GERGAVGQPRGCLHHVGVAARAAVRHPAQRPGRPPQLLLDGLDVLTVQRSPALPVARWPAAPCRRRPPAPTPTASRTRAAAAPAVRRPPAPCRGRGPSPRSTARPRRSSGAAPWPCA